jgi:FAD/FMN-containing dehydrogenase
VPAAEPANPAVFAGKGAANRLSRSIARHSWQACRQPATGCGALRDWLYPPPPVPGTWTNASRTIEVKPKHLERPESPAALVQLVQDAEKHGMRIRMTGSGHRARAHDEQHVA